MSAFQESPKPKLDEIEGNGIFLCFQEPQPIEINKVDGKKEMFNQCIWIWFNLSMTKPRPNIRATILDAGELVEYDTYYATKVEPKTLIPTDFKRIDSQVPCLRSIEVNINEVIRLCQMTIEFSDIDKMNNM